MKKLLLIFCGFVFINSLQAQTHQVLYGMTSSGGTFNYGVIFYYDLTTSTYTKKYEFFGGTPVGGQPMGSLLRNSDGNLFGLVSVGGTYGKGVLFMFNPNTSTYSDLYAFDGGGNGGTPYGSLIKATDGKLYGMTSDGCDGDGIAFKYNIAETSFEGGACFNSSVDGGQPVGDLIQATNGMLYGMTSSGGLGGYGIIFKYDPTSTSVIITDLYDFDFNTSGSTPFGGLVQASDGKLYGMTKMGGANSYGTLFQFDPITLTFAKKYDFSTATGATPNGSLMQASDGMLYGLTSSGGANNKGVLFQFNPTTSVYTKKFDFDGTANGGYPQGTLMQASNGMLYGLTTDGGTYGGGVIFQYNTGTSTITKKFDFNGAETGRNPIHTTLIESSVYVSEIADNSLNSNFKLSPNPSNGKFSIKANNPKMNVKSQIEVYNMIGEKIYISEFSQQAINDIDLSGHPKGVYLVKINDGEKNNNEKIVIQ